MISLIITTYNHASYIRETLDSVIMQNIDNLEVIVVDDGSRDETLEIAREFERPEFKIISKSNGGPSSALNYGISHVNGDFIVFLSGDDRLEPNSIEQRVSILRSGRADIVSSIPRWIDGDSNLLPDSGHPEIFRYYSFNSPLDLFSLLFYEGNMICAPSIAMTRACWDTVGSFNEDLWQLQDYEYWLRACGKGQVFHCLREPCISYRWHGMNLSLSNRAASEKELDFVLLAAPEWLDRGQLISLLWGRDKEELADEFDLEMLRTLLRIKHTRINVRNIGRWLLRNIANEPERRDILLRRLF
ncbi:glycosyltransferase [Brucella tritici]|uniref:glycosyltransferase n=1 Tax=Brucella tritici TaxID=94626 RepID=UPI002000A05C|nr:glycosyltransferase [Brucella tritici]